ncbi:MAG: MATE family efflux transporter [Neglectibacter timonensis]
MEEMTAQEKQFHKMTETPVPGLVTKLAVPTIISMLTTAIYNMADTFFVSQLGTSAAGAVGIVFSLMALIQAVGFMLGMGSGATISRLLGQQENREANRVGSTAFFTALFFGLLLTVTGLSWGVASCGCWALRKRSCPMLRLMPSTFCSARRSCALLLFSIIYCVLRDAPPCL